jgi:hypothetical protein
MLTTLTWKMTVYKLNFREWFWERTERLRRGRGENMHDPKTFEGEAHRLILRLVTSYRLFCAFILAASAVLILIRAPGGGVEFVEELFGVNPYAQSGIYLVGAGMCIYPHPLRRLWVYSLATFPIMIYGILTVVLVMSDPRYQNASLIMATYYFGLWLLMLMVNVWLAWTARLVLLVQDQRKVVYRYVLPRRD